MKRLEMNLKVTNYAAENKLAASFPEAGKNETLGVLVERVVLPLLEANTVNSNHSYTTKIIIELVHDEE